MLEIEPSEELLEYARNWLKEFHDDQDAPEVVGNWFKAVPSAESEALAAYYLQQTSMGDSLFRLALAVLEGKRVPRLYELMAELLEKTSRLDFWARCLPCATYMNNNPELEAMLLRWLELNEDNPKLDIWGVAVFTQSPTVIEKVFQWISTVGAKHKYNSHTVADLLRAAAHYHESLLPEIATFARRWLADNPKDTDAGRLHASLLSATRDSADVVAAKQWYSKNKRMDSSWSILAELLQCSFSRGEQADEFAVEEAKLIVAKKDVSKQKPALVGALVSAHPDKETVTLAKEVYKSTQLAWILIRLLWVAPDQELIDEAGKIFDGLIDSSIEDQFLQALLNADPDNLKARDRAEVWLAKEESAKSRYRDSIRELLASKLGEGYYQ